MKAQLIIIGNEILNGATQDINASFIARQLNEVGIAINEIRVISDESPIIEQQIKDALDYADLVITTGGLGPTNDDMTKDVLAQIAGKDIVYSEEALNSLASYYGNQATAQQRIREGNADIPEGATVLTNKRGTVPGLVMEINQKYIAASPGIPDEVKYLVEFQLIPFLKSKFNLSPVIHKSVLTVGIREAVLANSISDLEEKLPSRIKMAYLPNLGTVKLRFSGTNYDQRDFEQALQPIFDELHNRVGDYIFGYDDESLSNAVGHLLKAKNASVATAESCTGGYLAHQITSISGSSAYYKGSILSYSNELKMNILQVSANILKEDGAVSESTVQQMVQGTINQLHTDYAIATSGIMGPSGGNSEKPVGTVWIAAGSKEQIYSGCYHFTKDRFKNIHLTSVLALDMLRRLMLGLEPIRFR